MTRPEGRAALAGGAVGSRLAAFAAVSAAILAGCSSSSPGPGATTQDAPLSITVPLDATLATGSGVTAVVPMGHLDDPLNTFWQLFSLRAGASRWVLVTPTGVADNGGLVVSSATSATASATLAGFEPSQDLSFSPLATSTNLGASWSPGLLPTGLAAVPDATATSVGAGSVALVRTGGGTVLESSGNPSAWSKLVGRADLASSTADRSCGLGALTAVALGPTGGVQVGTTCSLPGRVGVFVPAGGAWHLVGPRLAGAAAAPTRVVRLLDVGDVTDGLVAVGRGADVSLVGVARTAGGGWSDSAPLPVGHGGRLASTGVEPGGGFVVVVARAAGSRALYTESGPAGAWQARPAPPPGTAAVAVGQDGVVDALVVATTVLSDWRLDAAGDTWSKIGTVTVPIQFGSSS